MRALVTGAAGFVGANLVRHLLRTGAEPVAIARAETDPWRLADLAGEVALEPIDLRDAEAIRRCVRSTRPDVIFHLAAHGAYSWQNDFEMMLAVNVRATEVLLEAAREVGSRLVAAGSSSEYGLQDHAAAETDALAPNSHYAVTKACATHLCRLAAQTHGQHAVTLRLYSVYGPWEQPGRLMPALVQRGLAGQLPPLVAPDTARDFVWVQDACEAFMLAAAAEPDDPGAVLNVASGVQSTLRAVVEVTRDVFAIEAEPVWGTMDQRGWDTTVWVGSPDAMRTTLGWRATTSLAAGLRRFGDWLGSEPAIAARYAPVVAG